MIKYISGLLLLTVTQAAALDNLLDNGSFDDADDPFKGWMIDYAWTKNAVYVENRYRVSLVPRDGIKQNVLKITPAGNSESKVESQLIPYEHGARYRCTMDVKANVKNQYGPTRIYFAGYRWKPGIRPHESPKPGETRMVYKSKAETGFPGSWKKVSFGFPMKKLSSAAKKHLRQVRFFSVYVWTAQGCSIDNVRVYKLP